MKKSNLPLAILCVITLVVMALPAIQMHGKLFHIMPLNGAVEERQYKSFTMRNYLDHSFQEYVEGNLADHFGFREWCIRGFNQSQWLLFRQWPHNEVLIGKDNWLFWSDDINDFHQSLACYHSCNNDSILFIYRRDAHNAYQLQEVLNSMGINFFICIAPSKSHTYPEYVPELKKGYRCSGPKAYDYYQKEFPRLGINHIDFNAYFAQIKSQVDYPLFYKFSSHWTQIAVANMADTLMRYLESIDGSNLLNVKVLPKHSSPPLDKDNDLIELINLLHPIEKVHYYYSDVKVIPDPNAKRPRMLAIGDSFCQVINCTLPMDEIFSSYHYWYYNQYVENDKEGRGLVENLDIVEELLSHDYIMLIWSPFNMYQLGHTFVQKALISLCIDDKRFAEVFDQTLLQLQADKERIEHIKAEHGDAMNKSLREEVYRMIYSDPAKYFPELDCEGAPTCRNPRAIKMMNAQHLSSKDQQLIQARHDIFHSPERVDEIKQQADLQLISDEAAFEEAVR